MKLPASAVPVIGWPEYAITPTGEVWRVRPSKTDGQYGPVPRPMKIQIIRGNKTVKLAVTSTIITRSVRAMIREHFGKEVAAAWTS